MKKLLLFPLLFFGFSSAFAQFTDDFSDGNFTSSPVWNSDIIGNWTIETNQLRSNSATTNSTFYISTPSTKATQAQWEFFVNLKFNTSSANYVDIYLISANENLNTVGNNGYFVRIGGTADEISFYKITNGVANLLINGTDGITNVANNTLKIKVTRDNAHLWTLQRDETGTGNNYAVEGTTTDNGFATSNFFGIRITQSTASFVNKHFFDDFYVGDIILDTESPTLSNVEVISQNQLKITFSENVLKTIAETTTNYSVNNAVGNPSTAQQDATDKKVVHLTFASNFQDGIENTLSIHNIEDLNNNILNPNPSTSKFTFIKTFEPTFHQLVITEIMADPDGSSQPLQPISEGEYLELYNNSEVALDLKNCKINDNTSTLTLPAFVLKPQEYVLICDDDNVADFQGFGKVISFTNFLSLTNSGELLTLENADSDLLFAVDYKDSWYQNSSKADGGWSLEMMDVKTPCRETDNWIASENPRGGTPAQANAIQLNKPDATAPRLLRAEALDPQTIRLTFNEAMEKQSLENGNYQITQGITIQNISVESPFFKRVTLSLHQPLIENQTYTLQTDNVRDCSENLIGEANAATFGLPTQGDSLDIILNEVLFNPETGGNDFIELYNHSTKFINLKGWKLANFNNGIISDQTALVRDEEDYVLNPQQYVLLSTDGNLVKNYYSRADEDVFLNMTSFPSYNDDEGSVILINNEGKLMERLDYQDDFHFALLNDDEGVSLERISFTGITNDKNNWQSASSTEGFATPGYRNSQIRKTEPTGQISITPKVFTPDGDGNEDYTTINYAFDQGGYVMNILIFDKAGRQIKTLSQNQLLGTQKGFFTWDGTDNNQNKARMGYYLVLIKLLDVHGNEQIHKETVVLATRF
jgi:hypothetical protein